MPGEPDPNQISPIDASCRAPIRVTVVCGALWLVLAAALEAIAAIKLAVPTVLVSSPFWTYGRVESAAQMALLYGFAVPAAFGLCAWLISRTGGVRLASAGMMVIASVFWNLGLGIGVLGILDGDATGFEGFQLPSYATPILYASYLLFAGCVTLTIIRRHNGALTVPQWFAITAIGWFGWIELTANLFLQFEPARGIIAPLIAAWHAQNLEIVVLGSAGLSLAFYVLPKMLEQPLGSSPLALFGLWSLALFGGFGGCVTPLPAWMGAVNTAAGVMSFLALLAIAACFWLTVRRHLNVLDANPALRFTYIATALWIIASTQSVLGSLPSVAQLVQFTFFDSARSALLLWGFVVMVLFGGLDLALPQILNRPVPSTRLRAIQFWCLLAGIALEYISQLIAGVAQGALLNDPANTFPVVMRTLSPPLQTAALGAVLVFAGVLCFGVNTAWIIMSKTASYASRPAGNVVPETTGVEPTKFGRLAGAGLALTLMVSWAALVAAPIFQLGGLQQATTIGADTRLYPTPRPGLAASGSQLFRAYGCAACHTQQVRPGTAGFDLARGWGKRRSVARDYIFDQPALPGSIRIGPDLANVGMRQNVDTFLLRMYDPTALTRHSIMPPYPFLFEAAGTQKNGRRELLPRPEARAIAAYLQSLRSDAPLYEVPPKVQTTGSLVPQRDTNARPTNSPATPKPEEKSTNAAAPGKLSSVDFQSASTLPPAGAAICCANLSPISNRQNEDSSNVLEITKRSVERVSFVGLRWRGNGSQVGNLRYGRLEVCATSCGGAT